MLYVWFQLCHMKQRYMSEMDLVKDKLQLVLAKKDGIIAALRQELQHVSSKLVQAEHAMMVLGQDNS